MFDVIIPIYRISKSFLERCLESVFDQTFEDYTVYVCDGTPVQHQDYDAKYLVESYGFVYVRQDPAHPLVSGARNQAVSLGSNPYLAFLDGDDWWYSQYLEEIKQEIIQEIKLELKTELKEELIKELSDINEDQSPSSKS